MTSDSVAILGTGLVGTSIAMAASRAGRRVTGWDWDAEVAGQAAERSGLSVAPSLAACVRDVGLVVVSSPIPVIAELAAEALREAPGAAVSDVGSIKAKVHAEVEAAAAAETVPRFVGGHPMGGSERSGPEHASASVVDAAVWVLTTGPRTERWAFARLERFVRSVGAHPVQMDPARHDRLVALVSHLPQVASTTLMWLAATEETSEPEVLLLAAGGFRDLTRLAASNPALWSEILLANREAITVAIDRYVERLRDLRSLIEEEREPELREAFAAAKAARLSLAAKPQVRAGVAVLQIEVPDRPGALAELTSALADASVNIEDLQIVHSPEGGRGAVHLTVAASAAVETGHVLASHGFDPTRLA
jgi:prephenate dehydrogenase